MDTAPAESQIMDNGKMNEPLNRHWISTLLREHPALLATITYVSASTIGMVYSWDYLRHFGINVFYYAQIGDFLLASLKEPHTWLLVLAAIAMMVFDNAMSLWVQRKGTNRWYRWYANKTYRALNSMVAMVIALLFLHVYAVSRVEETRAGNGESVQVILADSSTRSALLLGTTAQFLFLYDAGTRRVDIHPYENVQSISFMAPAQ